MFSEHLHAACELIKQEDVAVAAQHRHEAWPRAGSAALLLHLMPTRRFSPFLTLAPRAYHLTVLSAAFPSFLALYLILIDRLAYAYIFC